MCAEPVTIFLLERCATTVEATPTTETSTSTSIMMSITMDPCASVACGHGTCTVIFSARTLSTTPMCYQLPTSINMTTKMTSDQTNTVEKCKAIMMADETNEFYVLSGALCYMGKVNGLTQSVDISNCGNWREKCAGNGFGLMYQYIHTYDPIACTVSPSLCNAAKNQGYCIDELGSNSCICALGWTGTDCGTSV